MASIRIPDRPMYPHLTEFVKTELPKVRDKPRVWRAFLKYGEYNKRWLGSKWATFAFAWGSEPEIVIQDLPGLYGKYSPRLGKDRVFLATKLVDWFERNHRDAHRKLMIEATILHEMVHWADAKDGKLQLRELGLEAGFEFEKAAYGRPIIPQNYR